MKHIFFLFAVVVLLFSSCNESSKSGENPSPPSLVDTLSNDELLDLVQSQTFRYFWDFAHPVSGLARERSNGNNNIVTIGGSGFGVMVIIVGVKRGYITRGEAVERLLKITKFLRDNAERYHGAWSHWLNGETGKTIPFSNKDDGGDLVETSFMIQGLLTARKYFDANNTQEEELREIITQLWEEVEWSFYTRGENKLYWHWSKNYGWEMNMPIKGYNEALITYVLAASSPTDSIAASVYEGWKTSNHFINGKSFYDIHLPLGFDYGGPLFFAHYSFLGLDPNKVSDEHTSYWEQNVNHTLINRAYCIDNPKGYKGYGENCWGLTASDNHRGYSAHEPNNDLGVITPTAALSSFPYTPEYSMQVLKYLYYELRKELWGNYGFKDAFNLSESWFAESYLAIDQGPIVIMIENYRSGLLWDTFMKNEEVVGGLTKLGFQVID